MLLKFSRQEPIGKGKSVSALLLDDAQWVVAVASVAAEQSPWQIPGWLEASEGGPLQVTRDMSQYNRHKLTVWVLEF